MPIDRFRRFCNRRQAAVGRFAGGFRGCLRRGLPALRAKIALQAFPAFISCYLLWQCGRHFMAGCANFESADYRLACIIFDEGLNWMKFIGGLFI